MHYRTARRQQWTLAWSRRHVPPCIMWTRSRHGSRTGSRQQANEKVNALRYSNLVHTGGYQVVPTVVVPYNGLPPFRMPCDIWLLRFFSQVACCCAARCTAWRLWFDDHRDFVCCSWALMGGSRRKTKKKTKREGKEGRIRPRQVLPRRHQSEN